MNYNKRSLEITREYIESMRRRGYSREEVLKLIDEAESRIGTHNTSADDKK